MRFKWVNALQREPVSFEVTESKSVGLRESMTIDTIRKLCGAWISWPHGLAWGFPLTISHFSPSPAVNSILLTGLLFSYDWKQDSEVLSGLCQSLLLPLVLTWENCQLGLSLYRMDCKPCKRDFSRVQHLTVALWHLFEIGEEIVSVWSQKKRRFGVRQKMNIHWDARCGVRRYKLRSHF